jgi:hypothetical protein
MPDTFNLLEQVKNWQLELIEIDREISKVIKESRLSIDKASYLLESHKLLTQVIAHLSRFDELKFF